MKAEYSAPVHHHDFTFMFLPHDTNRQQIIEWSVAFSDCPEYRIAADLFGNQKHCGHIAEEHNAFEVTVRGRAKTGLDIYERNRFSSVRQAVEDIANAEKTSSNKTKAKKILDRD